jgi:hypothetical protein
MADPTMQSLSGRGLASWIAALGLLFSLAGPPSARGTVLLFDQTRDAATSSIIGPTGSGSDLPTDYGDNATGPVVAAPGGFFTYGEAGEGFTPDITIDIFSSTASGNDAGVRLWQTGYGDLVDVVFTAGPGIEGAPLLSVRLTAAPDYVVDLYDFDLAAYSAAGLTIAGVTIFDDGGAIFSATDVFVAGNAANPGHTKIEFATPLSAAELLVQIDLSNLAASIQDNVGLDSIRFGQTPPHVIPEPGTAILLFAGLAGLASRRRSPRT